MKNTNQTNSPTVPPIINTLQYIALTIGLIGLLILLISIFYDGFSTDWIIYPTLGMISLGIIVYAYQQYNKQPEGIKNDGVWVTRISGRKTLALITGIVLIGLYILLYWYPQILGLNSEGNTGLIRLFDPISMALKNQPASQSFVNAVLLTIAILGFGMKFIRISNQKAIGIVTGIILTGFYILLYWFPQILGLNSEGNTGLIRLFDPISMALKNQPASQWFVYGVLYTIAILGFGMKFIWKYKHNKYQQLRTISVMFFQLAFAFLLPEFMMRLNQPYYNFANMWPLNYYFFDEWHINGMLKAENVGLFMLVFGFLMIFLISPILTYLYGKRWYCSWVCGCGGLAETAGDPFRHLSSKKVSVWKFERWSIHIILVLSFIMTIAVITTYLSNGDNNAILTKSTFLIGTIIFLILLTGGIYFFKRKHLQADANWAMLSISILIILVIVVLYTSSNNTIFGLAAHQLRAWYGFAIGSAFSGVIGVGFYPILGSRVWCRFGCPMAGILGIQQKLLSRFRITTNGGQCISCGNCSTYCEMGIDVRSYAQKGQNIVRSSCVGCGVCSAVCPRGVLRLENGSVDIDLRADI